MFSQHRGTAAAVAALTLLSSQAWAAQRPPGMKPLATSPKAGLWVDSDKAELQVQQSPELDASPELNAYVRGVACKVAPDYCGELRLYILDRPYLNAAMAPNGYTEVWSGLLLRVEDEAELAFVLGHEVSHYGENHSLAAHEALKNRANAGMILAAGISAIGVAGAAGASSTQGAQQILSSTGDLARLAYLGSIATLFSFNREQESQADALGFRRAVAAGYRPAAAAAADLWGAVIADNAASDFDKVRKMDAQLSIFDDHPASAARQTALKTEAASVTASGDSGAERLRTAMRPRLVVWLRSELRRRDYGATLHLLDRLAKSGEDLGVINYYRGEAFRARRGDGDLARAAQAYAAACDAYQAYLTKASGAEDAWMVQDSLQALGKAN